MNNLQSVAFLAAIDTDLRKAVSDLMQQLEHATREVAQGRPILHISHTCQVVTGGGYFLTALVTFEKPEDL